MIKPRKSEYGFTLLELLIVIAVMAILAGVLFVALNPAARFEDSRNGRRWTDSGSILSALKLDQVDNGGSYHANIEALTDNMYYQIGSATTGCGDTCSNPSVTLQPACVDLLWLIDEGYLADTPVDPNAAGKSLEKTGYYVYKYDSGQLAVGSCHEELGSNASIPVIESLR